MADRRRPAPRAMLDRCPPSLPAALDVRRTHRPGSELTRLWPTSISRKSAAANLLTKDEAQQRIAANIAKLPELHKP